MKLIVSILALSICGLVVYLSLRSSPHMAELAWMPSVIAEWADAKGNGERRTAIPFFALSFLLSIYCLYRFPKHYAKSWITWEKLALVQLIVLIGIESAQVYIPTRHASLGDVIWGFIGIVAGGTPLYMSAIFFIFKRNK